MHADYAKALVLFLAVWAARFTPEVSAEPLNARERQELRGARATLRAAHRDAVRSVNEQLRLTGPCDPQRRECLLQERAAIHSQYRDDVRWLNQTAIRSTFSPPWSTGSSRVVTGTARTAPPRGIVWQSPVVTAGPSQTTMRVPAATAQPGMGVVAPASATAPVPAATPARPAAAAPTRGDAEPLRLLPIPDARPTVTQPPQGPQPTPARRPEPEANLEPLPTPAATRRDEPTPARR